jgi:hypothetical protein
MEECKIPAWEKMFCHLQVLFMQGNHSLGLWNRTSTPKDVSLLPPCSHSFFSKGKSQKNSEMFSCMEEYKIQTWVGEKNFPTPDR